MIRHSVLALAMVTLVFAAPVLALPTTTTVSTAGDIQARTWNLVRAAWDLSDRAAALAEAPDAADEAAFAAAADQVARQNEELGRILAGSLSTPDQEAIREFSEIYRAIDPEIRSAFFPALDQLQAAAIHDHRGALTGSRLREYFPGYGYSESGYKYRKGREVNREFKGETWQNEEQTVSMNTSTSLVISLDLLSLFQGMAATGAIRDLKVGKPFQMNVDGAPTFAVNISFQASKTITTKTTRKFEVNKIWFELLRAAGTIWTSGPWEVVGKTYVIAHEPTGDHLVTDAKPL